MIIKAKLTVYFNMRIEGKLFLISLMKKNKQIVYNICSLDITTNFKKGYRFEIDNPF